MRVHVMRSCGEGVFGDLYDDPPVIGSFLLGPSKDRTCSTAFSQPIDIFFFIRYHSSEMKVI